MEEEDELQVEVVVVPGVKALNFRLQLSKKACELRETFTSVFTDSFDDPVQAFYHFCLLSKDADLSVDVMRALISAMPPSKVKLKNNQMKVLQGFCFRYRGKLPKKMLSKKFNFNTKQSTKEDSETDVMGVKVGGLTISLNTWCDILHTVFHVSLSDHLIDVKTNNVNQQKMYHDIEMALKEGDGDSDFNLNFTIAATALQLPEPLTLSPTLSSRRDQSKTGRPQKAIKRLEKDQCRLNQESRTLKKQIEDLKEQLRIKTVNETRLTLLNQRYSKIIKDLKADTEMREILEDIKQEKDDSEDETLRKSGRISTKMRRLVIRLLSLGVPAAKVNHVAKAVSNILFDKGYTLTEKTASQKRKRVDGLEGGPKVKIQKSKHFPSHSFANKYEIGHYQEMTMQANALELVASAKDTSAPRGTYGSDAADHNRDHVVCHTMTLPVKISEGEYIPKVMLLALDEASIGGGQAAFDNFLLMMKKLVYLAAPDIEPETLEAITALLAGRIGYMNSDGASDMQMLAKFIQSWQELIGVVPLSWLKCLSHLIEGLSLEADNMICDIESENDSIKFVANEHTSPFLDRSSRSVYWSQIYAIYRCLGESTDSVSYSMTQEFGTFMDKDADRVLKCRLYNIKQSRFGKLFLAGRDMAYLYDSISRFLADHMKDNNMYATCVVYIKAPLLMEFSLALGIMYYHFVHPYMRATGIEGSEARLNQVEFMNLNPRLVTDLEQWADDPVHLLRPDRSGSFTDYPATLKVHPKDSKIYKYLFDDIIKNKKVNIEVVLGLCKSMCHKFVTVFERQLGALYLAGEDSVVAVQIKEDPIGIKFAAVNNLPAEHYFGCFRNMSDRFKGASISCISRRLLGVNSIFSNSLESMPDKLYEEREEWLNSPMYEGFKKIEDQQKNLEVQRKDEKLQKTRETRLNVVKKHLTNITKCQLHDGPVNNAAELTALVDKHKNDEKKLRQILEVEVCYQRDNVSLMPYQDKRYRLQKISNEKKEQNLKSLLLLGGNGSNIEALPTFNVEQALSSIEALNASYEGVNDTRKDPAEALLKKFNKPKPKTRGEMAAFYFRVDSVGDDWYIGEIRQIHLRIKCSDCLKLGDSLDQESDGVCFKIRFFDTVDPQRKNKFTDGKSRLWHVTHEQLIHREISLKVFQFPGMKDEHHLLPETKQLIDNKMKALPLRLLKLGELHN